jgi:hypothetical protein
VLNDGYVRTCHDTIPHLLLVGVVTHIIGMFGVLAVRPSLHPTQLRLRLVGAYRVDEHGQPRFIRIPYTAVMAGLLERDIIVRSVAQGLFERNSILNDPTLRVGTYPVTVGCRISEHERSMLLQRATAVVEIMHLHLNAFSITQRNEFLLYGIPRETVAYTQHPYE